MPIDLYHFPRCPLCHSVILLGKALGVHFNLKMVDLMAGDNMTPEYLQMNPQHTVPMIDDNGFTLSESRPIMSYLVSKYAKNDSLYPKDSKQRALVDQMLNFDAGGLYSNLMKCYLPVVKGLTHSIKEVDVERLEKTFGILNMLLDGKQFAIGDNLTIADFALSTTLCLTQCFDFDVSRYDNVAEYYDRCKERLEKFGFEDVHAIGIKEFSEIYHANLQDSS